MDAKLTIRVAVLVATFPVWSSCAEPPDQPRTQRPEITFTDVTAREGLPTRPTRSFGAMATDHDRDGDLDLFINRHADVPSLYAGQDGLFEQTISTFMRQEGYLDPDERVDRHGCAWGEANGDGLPDLYCTQGAKHGTSTGPNQLFLGADGRFDEVARRLGVDDPFGRGRAVNWLDHDLDGDLDLFVTNAPRAGYPSRMFRNDSGTFSAIDVGIGKVTRNWPASGWADWDGDRDPDLVVLGGAGGASFYENNSAAYRRVRLPGVPRGAWTSATWTDIDGNGRTDLHLISQKRALLLRNTETGFVRAHHTSLRMGRMSAWFDVENDGDLDALVVQGAAGGNPRRPDNVPDLLLLNDDGKLSRSSVPILEGPTTGNGDSAVVGDYDTDGRVDVFVANGHNPWAWKGPGQLFRNTSNAFGSVTLRLVGSRWNPGAFGARVFVVAGGLAYWRHVTDGVAYRAQSAPADLVLGLREADTARVVVEWPDATVDCFEGRAGTVVVARRGASPCRLP